MKRIESHKKTLNFKFLFKATMILILHYVLFLIYIMIFRIYSIVQTGLIISPSDNVFYYIFLFLFFFYIFIGPGLNSICNIHYLNTGSLMARVIMWLNTLFFIIIFPLSITIF